MGEAKATTWFEAFWWPMRTKGQGERGDYRYEFRTAPEMGEGDLAWNVRESGREIPEDARILARVLGGDLFDPKFPPRLRDQVYAAMTRLKGWTFLVSTAYPIPLRAYCRRENHFGAAAAWRDMVYGPDSGVSVGDGLRTWPPRNVWHALRVANQAEANERIPSFLHIPGVRLLDLRPVEPITPLSLGLYRVAVPKHREHWPAERVKGFGIRLEGETGPNARPLHPAWVRSIRDQCQECGVPFRFGGWGEWAPRDSAGWWTGPETKVYPEEGIALLRDGRVMSREFTAGEQLRRNREAGRPLPGNQIIDATAWDDFRRECNGGPEMGHQWMFRVGPERSGRELDGTVWNQYPEVS